MQSKRLLRQTSLNSKVGDEQKGFGQTLDPAGQQGTTVGFKTISVDDADLLITGKNYVSLIFIWWIVESEEFKSNLRKINGGER